MESCKWGKRLLKSQINFWSCVWLISKLMEKACLKAKVVNNMVLWVVQNDPFCLSGCLDLIQLINAIQIMLCLMAVDQVIGVWCKAAMRQLWGISLGGLDLILFGNKPILMLWFNSIDWSSSVKLVLWEFLIGSFRGLDPCASSPWCSVPVLCWLCSGSFLVPFWFRFWILFRSCSSSFWCGSWISGRVLVRVQFLGFWLCSWFWFVFGSCSWSLGVLVHSSVHRVLVLLWFHSCSVLGCVLFLCRFKVPFLFWSCSSSIFWVSGCVLRFGLILSSSSCSGSWFCLWFWGF